MGKATRNRFASLSGDEESEQSMANDGGSSAETNTTSETETESEDSRAEDLVATSRGFLDAAAARELIDDYSQRPAGSDLMPLVAAMVKRIKQENPGKRCTNQVRKAIGDQLWADASYDEEETSSSTSKGEPSGFEDFQERPSTSWSAKSLSAILKKARLKISCLI